VGPVENPVSLSGVVPWDPQEIASIKGVTGVVLPGDSSRDPFGMVSRNQKAVLVTSNDRG